MQALTSYIFLHMKNSSKNSVFPEMKVLIFLRIATSGHNFAYQFAKACVNLQEGSLFMNHRITDGLKLEGTSGSLTLFLKQCYQKMVAQDHVQTGFEYLQG